MQMGQEAYHFWINFEEGGPLCLLRDVSVAHYTFIMYGYQTELASLDTRNSEIRPIF